MTYSPWLFKIVGCLEEPFNRMKHILFCSTDRFHAVEAISTVRFGMSHSLKPSTQSTYTKEHMRRNGRAHITSHTLLPSKDVVRWDPRASSAFRRKFPSARTGREGALSSVRDNEKLPSSPAPTLLILMQSPQIINTFNSEYSEFTSGRPWESPQRMNDHLGCSIRLTPSRAAVVVSLFPSPPSTNDLNIGCR